jgi:2-methylisocitrate lyase-like PEP mutase family enzyme
VAAADAARKYNIVLAARADGLGKGVYDLEEAIRRLKAFEALGAEVVCAPAWNVLRDPKPVM